MIRKNMQNLKWDIEIGLKNIFFLTQTRKFIPKRKPEPTNVDRTNKLEHEMAEDRKY